METWSAYFSDTGLFTGRRKSSSNSAWTPPAIEGVAWKQGAFDRRAQCVDIETGEVVSYTPPPPTLEELKAAKWDQIKRDRTAAEYSGFEAPGIGVFQSDPDSQRLITGSFALAQLALAQSAPFSITWTLADNSTVDLNAMGMIGVGVALGTHVDGCYTDARTARAAIDAATTAEEVAAVELSPP